MSSSKDISPVVPFDFDVEDAIIHERRVAIHKENKARKDLRKNRSDNMALAAIIRNQINELKALLTEKRGLMAVGKMDRKRIEGEIKESSKLVKDMKATIAQSKMYKTLGSSFPLHHLPPEVKVMILRLVFKEENPIEINKVSEIAKYIQNPICGPKSGVQGEALQVIFQENHFKIPHPDVAAQFFNKRLPKNIKFWMENLAIYWGTRSFFLCKPIIGCRNLKSLTLRMDFSQIAHPGTPADLFSGAAGTKKLLANLPTSCQVTILDTYEENTISRWNADIRETHRLALQAVFDNRAGPPAAPIKPAHNRNGQSNNTLALSAAIAAVPAIASGAAVAPVAPAQPAIPNGVPVASVANPAVPASTPVVPVAAAQPAVPSTALVGPVAAQAAPAAPGPSADAAGDDDNAGSEEEEDSVEDEGDGEAGGEADGDEN